MFDIGFWELSVIGLIALIVLGPGRLPEAARTAGRWVGRARRFVADVKRDLNEELSEGGLAEFRRLKEELTDTRRVFERSAGELVGELNRPVSLTDTADASPVRTPARGTRKKSRKTTKKKASGRKAAAKTSSRRKKAPGRKAAKTSPRRKKAVKKAARKKRLVSRARRTGRSTGHG